MANKVSIEEEFKYEDVNEERGKFKNITESKDKVKYKYEIHPVVKIEKRIEGRYAFKDIFKVISDLKEALPVGENLFPNEVDSRSTIKQTITYPRKWFNDLGSLKAYYQKLCVSLNNFLFDKNGSNRYISQEYRVIDYEIFLTDVISDHLLTQEEIQNIFK